MAATRKPADGRSARPLQEKEEAARAWLGSKPSGGERLARVFQVGSSARATELEAELARLRAKIDAFELELSLLRKHADGADSLPDVGSAAPLVELQLPRALLPSERDYRLARCEGFSVYAGARLLGVVEGVRYRSSTDRPDTLEVRGGRLGRHLLLIPANDIEAIEPEDEAVVVNDEFCSPRARERLRAHLERSFRRRARR
jgi:hypothetical protein